LVERINVKTRNLLAVFLTALVATAACGPFYSIQDGAREGDALAVGVLLDRNPQLVHARNDFGDTPLHQAVIKGHYDVVLLLLQKGADVNARRQYTTWEYAAVLSGRPLDWVYRPSIGQTEVRVKDGETALHLAAQYGRYRIATLLIRAGAWLNPKDHSGWTPLHWAAAQGHMIVVQLLVRAGARVAVKNYLGKTPVDLAAEGGHARVANYLRWLVTNP
jgi:ankyrin repeat protein